MSYEVLGADDENYAITVTDGAVTTIEIAPVIYTSAPGGGGAVDSVNGQTGVVVLTTTDIAEGDNLYYTQGRFDSAFGAKSTTNLAEGTNLYYTDDRVNTFLTDGSVSSINFGGNTSISWNADEGTLEFPVNGEVTLQVGQENLIHVKNLSGATLNNGAVVRVTGASGSKLTVDLANNTSDGVSADTIAVMTQSLNNNAVGYATTEGLVRGLNTSALTEGAVLWLDGAGVFTETKPLTPLHLVQVGYVVRSHATEGTIFVSIKNGWELDELHDVLITGVSDGQGLVWDAGNGYWKNATITVDLTGYATEAYVDSAISAVDLSSFTTDDLAEGTVNLYYTDGRVGDYLTANNYATTGDIPTQLSDLSDANITGAVENDILAWTGTEFANTDTIRASTYEYGSDNKMRLRSGADGGAVDTWVFDATASDIFTGQQWRTTTNRKIFRFDAIAAGGVDPGDGSHQTSFVISGVNNTLKSRRHNETVSGLTIDAEWIELLADNGSVSINGAYYLPAADGTLDQVLATNGAGNLYWADAGSGGGASSLNDLTDVTITSAVDGDLLRYNGTASEWQNTNLGISIAPTISFADPAYSATPVVVTITNWGDYDDANIWAQVVDAATLETVVVPNSAITDNGDGTFTFTAPTDGEYEIQVRIQDFGDLASEVTQEPLTTVTPIFRYIRLTIDDATSHNMIDNFFIYSGAGQTGTRYPESDMTSNTTPSPYVTSASHEYTGYGAWEAFNVLSTTTNSWWNLGNAGLYATPWLQIDLGSAVTTTSFFVSCPGTSYQSGSAYRIYGSNTGAFAGEESLLGFAYTAGVASLNYYIG